MDAECVSGKVGEVVVLREGSGALSRGFGAVERGDLGVLSRLLLSLTLCVLLTSSCSGSVEDVAVSSGDFEGRTRVESDEWYNSRWLRPLFGDYERIDSGFLPEASRRSYVERGRYLVREVAFCATCHVDSTSTEYSGAPLSGGRLFEDRFGRVFAANITPDPETGIGEWSLKALMRAIRAAIDKTGRPLSLDVHGDYRWMSDRDALAISAYLLALKPVSHRVERRKLGAFERRKWWIFSEHKVVEGYVPELPRRNVPQYGRYLVEHVAACSLCHSGAVGEGSLRGNSGVSVEEGRFTPPVAPELRDLVSKWTEGEVLSYLGASGSESKAPGQEACPQRFRTGLADVDKRAIARYLARR